MIRICIQYLSLLDVFGLDTAILKRVFPTTENCQRKRNTFT